MTGTDPFERLQNKLRAAGCKLDGTEFVGRDGKPQKRDFRGAHTVPIDLDCMGQTSLEEFVAYYRKQKRAYQVMFPLRPVGAQKAAKLLLSMADSLWHYQETGHRKFRRSFDARYKQLPAWAQWRRTFNPLGTLEPGQKPRTSNRITNKMLPVLRLAKSLDSPRKRR